MQNHFKQVKQSARMTTCHFKLFIMKHLMIDIETLGHKSNSVITQISAVEFDINTGQTGRVFNKFIDIQSCLDVGLKCTGSTLNWWLNQSKEAQEVYIQAEKIPLQTALNHLSFFIQNKSLSVWGNSARFDLGLIENAYDACGLKYPITFWKELDVRTIVFLNPEVKKNTEFVGIPHNGIDDCKHQIKYIVEILKNNS